MSNRINRAIIHCDYYILVSLFVKKDMTNIKQSCWWLENCNERRVFTICTHTNFEQGEQLWDLCIKPHTTYLISIYSLCGIRCSTSVGWHYNWKHFEPHTFSIMDVWISK